MSRFDRAEIMAVGHKSSSGRSGEGHAGSDDAACFRAQLATSTSPRLSGRMAYDEAAVDAKAANGRAMNRSCVEVGGGTDGG